MPRRDREDRWLLEYDSDEEIYTLPSVDDAAIERVISMFDGWHTFYCGLSDVVDESCLWCVGEPDRRLIEGRRITGNVIRHFVLRHRHAEGENLVRLRHGAGPADVLMADPSEIFNPSEASSILLAFHRDKTIPLGCEEVDGVRLFGSHTFGT